MIITAEDRAKIREILDKASQGKFQWGTSGTKTNEEHLAYMAKTLAKTDDQGAGLNMVYFVDEETGKDKIAAYTGNGPTSEANAILFTMAPQIIRALLSDNAELTGEIERLKSNLENYELAYREMDYVHE